MSNGSEILSLLRGSDYSRLCIQRHAYAVTMIAAKASVRGRIVVHLSLAPRYNEGQE